VAATDFDGSALVRSSGRSACALRQVQLQAGFNRHAEGSVLISMGDTRVLCNASVLERVPPFLKGQGKGWVTAEYGMLPRATHTRSEREAARGKQSGRTQEIQRLIGRSLRAAFDLHALGERTLHLDCDVLQADGGTRCASITGAWAAAALAVRRLRAQGVLDWEPDRDPMREQVAAVSVGCVQGRTLVDLDYAEDAGCDADMNIVMTASGQFVEVQGTAEGRLFSRAQLAEALELAQAAIARLHGLQTRLLQEQS